MGVDPETVFLYGVQNAGGDIRCRDFGPGHEPLHPILEFPFLLVHGFQEIGRKVPWTGDRNPDAVSQQFNPQGLRKGNDRCFAGIVGTGPGGTQEGGG